MKMEMKMKISHILLPDDVWQIIGLKLEAVDRIRFRAVFKLWMSLIPHQPPWLMLADSEDDETVLPPPRTFVCVGEPRIYRIHFPEIHRTIPVGSTGNWAITAPRDGTIRLLNPFSRQQLSLPPQLALGNVDYKARYNFRFVHLWKIILSSSPDDKGCRRGECIAMAAHNYNVLAIARLGDLNWTTVQFGNRPLSGIHDILFYKGRFYAISGLTNLYAVDVRDGLNPPPLASLLTEPSNLKGDLRKTKNHWINYLVEWLDELVLVMKCSEKPLDSDRICRTFEFELYKFDFVDRKWNELKSLGEHSLFLGLNASVSLRASDYFGLIQKNCIYFTDDYTAGHRGRYRKGGHDMGVFDLGDNSIRRHFRGASTPFYTPPLWIVPT